jgi:hypothetical protein
MSESRLSRGSANLVARLLLWQTLRYRQLDIWQLLGSQPTTQVIIDS